MTYRCWDSRGRERVYRRYTEPVGHGRWIRGTTVHGRAAVWAEELHGPVAESAIGWPIDVVALGNSVAGMIAPVVPAGFRLRDGRFRTLEDLCAPARNPPDAARRVGVLIRVCDLFVLLEAAQFGHGHVELDEIAWRDEPLDAYLLRADRLRPYGAGCDGDGDRLTLAVLIYQGLFLGPADRQGVYEAWQVPGGLPAGLDMRLWVLFDRAFTGENRPGPVEWRDGLAAVYLTPDGSSFLAQPLSVLDEFGEYFRGTIIGQVAAVPPYVAPRPRRRRGWSVGRIAAVAAGIMLLLAVAVGLGMGAAVLAKRSGHQPAAGDPGATTSVRLNTAAATVVTSTAVTSTVLVTSTPVVTTSAVAAAPPAQDRYAAVVLAYFDAINRHDYDSAWNLGGDVIEGGNRAHFPHEFDTLSRDAVTVFPTGGPTVYAHLDAYQLDGSVQHFDGYYVVRGPSIVQWNIHPSS
ncbi:hypothetical protein ACIP5Y_19800 [Nocardia sp. NPDC088792]|uniref:hypothetical protein n=1 Tax=Nocardia sp. NPDC088792 TaxID=3364332 RepID=UPI0037FB6E43